MLKISSFFRNTFLCLVYLSSPIFAQNDPVLSGSLENFYGSYLYLDQPHKTGAVEASQIKLVIDDDASFSQSIAMKEAGFLGMFDTRAQLYLRFWLEPNKELTFTTDWNELFSTVNFKGELAPANNLVKSFALKRYETLENGNALIEASFKELIKEEELELQSALNTGQVSKQFFDVMLLDSKYFWTNQALAQGRITANEAKSQVDVSNELALKSRNYFSFLRTYFQKVDQFETLKQKYSAASEQLSDQVLELFWAYDIRQESMSDRMNFELLEVFESYKEKYNDEKLISYIYKYLLAIENEYYRMNTPIKPEMELVQNSDITIHDIIDKFKGEVLYFDIWATWCKPCIMEMGASFKAPLEEFIKDKKIKVIYISDDIDAVQDKWAKMVKDFRLNSFNVRMEGDYFNKLLEFIGVDRSVGFGIPRYFIIDKNNNLVNADAPRPSDREKLYKELSKYL